MLKLIRNVDIYTPSHLGIQDILICGNKISLIEKCLEGYESLPNVEIIDASGMYALPAYIDQHIHITGGGGEQGFSSRVPEVHLSEIISAGVTTVIAMLGTDSINRTLENVLAKARALEEEGITAFMLTGSYSYPPVTLTGSITRDIVLIDKIIGAKIALSDHRSSNVTSRELIRLCSEACLGGIISGKAGLTVIHMGAGKGGFKQVYELIENSDIPIGKILPTHVGRNDKTLEEAIEYAKFGGFIDFTAGQSGVVGETAAQIAYAIGQGVNIEQISFSSDGCGSQPIFNESKKCIGITYTKPWVLHEELRAMIKKYNIPIEKAITFVTKNVANIVGLQGKKGELSKNADADIVIWDKNINIKYVFANGNLVAKDGLALLKGRFEK